MAAIACLLHGTLCYAPAKVLGISRAERFGLQLPQFLRRATPCGMASCPHDVRIFVARWDGV